MKNRLILIALVFIAGAVVTSCKTDPPPTKSAKEVQLIKLVKTWVPATTASAITVAGNDVSQDWASFVLTLGDGTYNSSGQSSPEVWPGSGTWAFASDTDLNTLVRDDGVIISVAVTETTMQLQFDYSLSGGRLSGVDGNWVFNMVPQ